MKRISLYLIFIISLLGCVEDFDFKLKKAEPRIVVEGLITNKPGPYYIRVVKSKTGNINVNYNDTNPFKSDHAEPITDALIVVTDNKGQCDTLKYTVIDVYGNEYGESSYNQGFYKTTNLKGIPEHTYNLKIISEGKEYQASAYMAPVPKIDSLGYYLKKSELVGKGDSYIPLLYFKEPQDTINYYLIQLQEDFHLRIFSSVVLWQFSILSDKLLQPYVNGLNVSIGATPRGIVGFPAYQEGDSIYVALNSLSKEACSYYKVLLEQFDSDGGAYKPTPTSPPTNISNGGLGLFRASAVSERRTKIPRTNVNNLPMN